MKNKNITIEDIFNLPTAEIFNPDNYNPITSVLIDSRNVVKNSLFVAIKGEKFDGHDFVRDAIKNGASAVVISKSKFKNFNDLDIPVIAVKDTVKALGNIAAVWRKKLNAKIIALTGSSGKTSTKEMIALLLNERYSVNKTIGNNNNHIGVPLTILSTNEKHDLLVLELGTNHFGEIEYTANIAQPDYSLITNIGYSHLEFLKNLKGVYKEKEALFQATSSRKGFLFINNDDALLKKSYKGYINKITFGFSKDSDIVGKISGYSDDGRPEIEINYKNKKIISTLPLYGEHNAYNYLAAVSIALKLGLTRNQIESATAKFSAVEKRLNVKNFGSFIIIDDTYNANPESMKHALKLLSRINSFKRKIAVLGDMFELGKEEINLHKQIGKSIKKNKINELYTIGKRMKNLYDGVKDSKILKKHFKTRDSLKNFLNNMELSDSVILVKGSRGMKMEEFVRILEQRI